MFFQRTAKIPFWFLGASSEMSQQLIKRTPRLLLALLGMLVMVRSDRRWAIMSTIPLPMPVMYDAQVFPWFFTTNKTLGVAFLPQDRQLEQVKENRTIFLKGSLCFKINGNGSSCIPLNNQFFAQLGETTKVENRFEANATVLYG